jgi:hypothetical protein
MVLFGNQELKTYNPVIFTIFLLKLCRMFSRRLIVMLMLMVALMPVVMAAAYYSDISNQLLSGHPVNAVDLANDDSISSMQQDDHCQPNKSHAAGCSFHVCVDCAITSSFEFAPPLNIPPPNYPEKADSTSIIAPLDIKPPIYLL